MRVDKQTIEAWRESFCAAHPDYHAGEVSAAVSLMLQLVEERDQLEALPEEVRALKQKLTSIRKIVNDYGHAPMCSTRLRGQGPNPQCTCVRETLLKALAARRSD